MKTDREVLMEIAGTLSTPKLCSDTERVKVIRSRVDEQLALDPLRQPDIFERSGFLVDELIAAADASAEILQRLRAAMVVHDAPLAHRSTLALAARLAQISSLNSSLATQLVGHMVQEKIDGRPPGLRRYNFGGASTAFA